MLGEIRRFCTPAKYIYLFFYSLGYQVVREKSEIMKNGSIDKLRTSIEISHLKAYSVVFYQALNAFKTS